MGPAKNDEVVPLRPKSRLNKSRLSRYDCNYNSNHDNDNANNNNHHNHNHHRKNPNKLAIICSSFHALGMAALWITRVLRSQDSCTSGFIGITQALVQNLFGRHTKQGGKHAYEAVEIVDVTPSLSDATC